MVIYILYKIYPKAQLKYCKKSIKNSAATIVCTVIIDVIKGKSPINCRERINELGAVGIIANRTNIAMIKLCSEKEIGKRYIISGKTINFAIIVTVKSFFALFISFRTNV